MKFEEDLRVLAIFFKSLPSLQINVLYLIKCDVHLFGLLFFKNGPRTPFLILYELEIHFFDIGQIQSGPKNIITMRFRY